MVILFEKYLETIGQPRDCPRLHHRRVGPSGLKLPFVDRTKVSSGRKLLRAFAKLLCTIRQAGSRLGDSLRR